eukprot:CAMPEP_0114145658 /NCGR_PEP_ID=MMETSP0043_2-20121206/20160_1 /TAXON_ID=464988 /ORGANISM="Hemiselmis andersenii, Strain CCMP644" /LENGTH=64 /DNA_ID=CAMNT_0001240083 /DNA_START=77 /DNA_END=268 /DNA_ORIENTATION=-
MEEGTDPPPNPFGAPAARFKPSAGFDESMNVGMEEDEEGDWSDDEAGEASVAPSVAPSLLATSE